MNRRILTSQKSPSEKAMERTYNRAILNGGVTQDFSANVENIRDISRKLNYDICNGINSVNGIPNTIRNLSQYSQEMDNAAWSVNNITVTPNVDVAPDGTTTADKLTFTAITHLLANTSQYTLPANTTYTVSFYAKRGTATNLKYSVYNRTISTDVISVTSYYTQTNSSTYSRISFQFTTSSTANQGYAIYPTRDSGVTGDCYIWGIQLELGTIATGYQLTTNTYQNPTSAATFLYVPSSYGEGKNFAQVQNKRNLLINSDTGPTQSVTVTAQTYTLALEGTGTYTLSGVFTGSLVGNGTSRVTKTFTPTAGTLTLTLSGSITKVQLEQGAYTTPYQKTVAAGDGIVDFNFTRATSATVTNKLGVIEDSCYNILTFSDQLDNAAWLVSNTSITPNTNLNPFKINKSYYLLDNATSGTHLFTQIKPFTINTIYTTSYYVRKADDDWIQFSFNTANFGQTYANFNLTTGLFGNTGANLISFSATSLNNGWYIVSITAQALATNSINIAYIIGTNNSNSILAPSYVGSGRKVVDVAAVQFIQGSTPRPYLRTTNRLNVSRLDYSLSLAEPSLLIEPQRTNLLIQSESLTTSWVTVNTTITPNTSLNPFEINKSYYITDTTSNTVHYFGQSTTATLTVGQPFTTSFYIKKADDSWVQLTVDSNRFGNLWVNFNFDTGLFGNNGGIGNWTAKQLINGYWLLTLTGNCTVVGAPFAGVVSGTNNLNSSVPTPVYIGSNRKICNIAAVQFEAGSNATSYIPTTTATVTRNAETNYEDLFNNAALNQTNWTLFYEGYLYDGQPTNMSLVLSDTNTAASNTNQIGWQGQLQPLYNVGNVRTSGGASTTNNTFNRFAIQYNNGIVNYYVNGINIWTNASVPVFNYRYFVLNSGNSTYTTDKIALFNRTMTDTECINLTNNTSITFTPFVSTWNTSNTSAGSSTATQVKLPLASTGTYAMNVDWGDGTKSGISTFNQPEVTHTYASAGTYTISISGTCTVFSFANTGDKLKFMSVQKWGNLNIGNLGAAFQGCANLTLSTVSDILSLNGITNLSSLFNGCSSLSTVNHMNEWNTSTITLMNNAFQNCTNFNQDISSWDTSNITNFGSMFSSASAFNQNISGWNTSSATNMLFMFFSCTNFNQPIGSWNTTNVTSLSRMFEQATAFNQNIGTWNVTKCSDFSRMFYFNNVFNNGGSNSINNWVLSTTSNINMSQVFENTAFNQPIGSWNMSKVTTVNSMFLSATVFNQNLSGWNLPICTDFTSMFQSATNFNNGLASGVSGTMSWTLNTTTSINMASMFQSASAFNQDISGWNVSKVNTFSSAFAFAFKFNQNIGSWNTSGATDMSNMFQTSTASDFNQNIGSWNISNVTNFGGFMTNKTPATFSTANLDAIYNGWSTLPSVKSGISITFGTAKYTAASSAGRAILTSAPNNWLITDGSI